MSYFNQLFSSVLVLAAISCNAPKTSKPAPEVTPEFEAVLNAHGDWEKWYYAKAESYSMIHESVLIEENAFINLGSRKIRLSNTEFEMGYDGKKTWVSPDRSAYKGPSVKFYHNLYFYFFNIPFIFTDPGVTVVKIEDRMLNGKKHPTFRVTFASKIGDSPEDQYYMLINPETNRLEYLLYTVTFFDNPDPKTNALKYEDYRESEGVFFPRILTGYTLENDSTKSIRYQVTFADPMLLDEEFEEDIFQKPENGVFAD